MIEWLAGWYNWPFLLALLIGLGYAIIEMLFGGLGLADADGDVATPEGDLDADLDADGVADRAGGLILSSLAWLGMGKVPLSILIMVMLISFGSAGLLANAIAADTIGITWVAFPLSLGIALVVAPSVTHIIGGWLARNLPGDSSTAAKSGGFTGDVGLAASTITARSGLVCLPEDGGRPQIIVNACVVEGGDTIPRGTNVLLTAYIAERNTYIVTPTNLEL